MCWYKASDPVAKSPKPPPPEPAPSSLERAQRLLDLLTPGDPALAEQRRRSAAAHSERARRQPRVRAPIADDGGAKAVLRAVEEGQAPARATRPRAPRPPPPEEPRVYVHQGPTRSLVLNAFLHAFQGFGLVEPNVAVLDEHRLAGRLSAFARGYWPQFLRADREEDLAHEIELTFLRCVEEGIGDPTSDAAARFFMRRAEPIDGELGAIARDYAAHRARHDEPPEDDRRAHAIMATFAGAELRLLQQRLGPHLRDDVRRELGRLTAESAPTTRHDAARATDLPAGAPRQDVRRSRR